ncbi:hypothetical protein PR048_001981 [Dryococelus australis]|uniref:Uncharacterized protein n=1 Tax=Dryococelus australis TaxID=614101 RepID=A0ABQ9IIZ7_9NEOP|nr:hypothetical protein PR048_001981 [Dryococelus australis]
MSYAQMRSPYAPNPVGVVKVLPRFQNEEENFPNRLGEEETVRPPPSTPSSLAGANVDPELASRVAKWPKEQQPFWFQNAQAIRNHQQKSVNALPPPPPRTPFAANLRN